VPRKEDFQGFDPWFRNFFPIVGLFIDTITRALRNQLTFTDNFNSEVVTRAFTHNVAKTIALKVLAGKPEIVIPGFTQGNLIDAFGFQVLASGLLEVTIKFDGAPVDPINVTLYVLSG